MSSNVLQHHLLLLQRLESALAYVGGGLPQAVIGGGGEVPSASTSTPVRVRSFGREDRLDLDAPRRLMRTVCSYLQPAEASEIQRAGMESPFQFVGSLEEGGAWLPDQLWKRLQLDRTLRRLVKDRSYAIPMERLPE